MSSFSGFKTLLFAALSLVAFTQLALAASLPAPLCAQSYPANPQVIFQYVKEKPFKYETYFRNPHNDQAFVHIKKDFARYESMRRVASNLTPKARHMAVEFLARDGSHVTQYLQVAPQTVCSIDSSNVDGGKIIAVYRWKDEQPQQPQQPCEP